MAFWTASHKTITPTATADATNLVDSTYPFALQGGSATQKVNVSEIYLGGQAGASSPTFMCLGRDSQVATGSLTADANLMAQAQDPATAALALPVAVFNKAATNKPQRSTTLGGLLNLSFNAFGGIVRWVCQPRGEIVLLGNVASFGELSLSAFTGGTAGLLGAHVVYEPL
jgi:hypothetical protein